MHLETSSQRSTFLLFPEHGGDAVAGGGHPADTSPPIEEAIDEALGQEEGGRGKIPGVGVPGSKGNPVGIIDRAQLEAGIAAALAEAK